MFREMRRSKQLLPPADAEALLKAGNREICHADSRFGVLHFAAGSRGGIPECDLRAAGRIWIAVAGRVNDEYDKYA